MKEAFLEYLFVNKGPIIGFVLGLLVGVLV